jgi:pimeloyl-ACP methyl ester carboxylesterase
LLAALIRNARLRIVAGAGHLLLFDSPDDVLADIVSFLEGPRG